MTVHAVLQRREAGGAGAATQHRGEPVITVETVFGCPVLYLSLCGEPWAIFATVDGRHVGHFVPVAPPILPAVTAFIAKHGPVTTTQIAAVFDMSIHSAGSLVCAMAKRGEVRRHGKQGRSVLYAIAEEETCTP